MRLSQLYLYQAWQTCEAAPGINCAENGNTTFKKEVDCKWTNGYNFETALLLSIFLVRENGTVFTLEFLLAKLLTVFPGNVRS